MRNKRFIIAALTAVILVFTFSGITVFAAEESDPFIPGGTGTVIEDIVEKNGKEFYTIRTETGNIFYLIVDRLRESDNVYFLNAVTEADLLALAEKEGIPIDMASSTESRQQQQTQQSTSKQETEPTQNSGGLDSNTATIIFVVIAVIAVGGIGFYLKIIKGKKNKDSEDDFDDSDDSDDFDDETGEFEL